MGSFKYILLALLVVGGSEAIWSKSKQKRSPMPMPKPEDVAKGQAAPNKPSWQPVSEPREFTVMVDDNINKANQFRHETWRPGGVIEGEYASPSRDGKWLKVSYRADKDGFHILNQQVVTEAELDQPAGGSAADHQAKVETHQNGKDISYTIKEDDLKKAAAANKANKDKQQQEHTGL